ncbi:ChaN family lipoprotein [Roseomonas eburnea]|uniref:ChaN family lipoprotein n=1 Tax=Neoroseomonas eburnea TaxID=1346889 RepID=A0A9X9XKJ9_9PROT|nr:ChaN family lipoprotein [Neoroseomonas eburnea]MBR0684235.1 ChaN family lipoprotein [Neoroseomonas eburnea]
MSADQPRISPSFPHPRAAWLDPGTGARLEPAALMARMARRQVVLLGETHDVAEIHRWQLQVATCLHLLRPDMQMGFEMFPRRLQPVLDRWVAGGMGTAEFLEQAEWEKVWGFPPEIYLPLFHFCRQQGVRMLALNCHRPLVTRVGKEGWDAVPEEERDGLTPSAAPTAGHRAYIAMLTGRRPEDITDRFIRAQQVWDRAFACNIVQARREAEAEGLPAPLVVGIMGRGHVDYGHGTPHQLRDLGVTEIGILLPTGDGEHDAARVAGIGDALFRLDPPEPPAERGRPTA